MKKILSILSFVALLAACTSHPSIPSGAQKENKVPMIQPDYTDVTIPCNIAPCNFAVLENCEEAVARFTYDGGELVYGEGQKILIDEAEWKQMLEASKGKNIKVEVFAKKDGQWKEYNAFNISVADDEIDQYISYRLIQPSYVAYEQLSINQRDITTFEETDVYNNMSISTEKDGQCINCHSYQNYKTDRMLFHMRQAHGGTMIVDGKNICKVDLKTEQTISAGVYPSWHPTLNLVAFSTNKTGQSFHTKSNAKIEVQDTKSDLILYDVEKNEIYNVANDSTELEVFPTWSPDGKYLYYCSAHFEYQNDSLAKETEMIKRYQECKYDIYRLPFNEKNYSFGPRELVYKASDNNKSATLPRISPDGHYLVFAEGNWGCFHIWHPEADIKCIDLKSDSLSFNDISVINSNRAESYPVISSNGRWIMMESRRDDSNYTRPYIAYIDKNGKAHKAFEVPQKDPSFYTYFLKSYNRPEFMIEPVKVTPQEFTAMAKTEAKKATFVK